MTLMCDSGVMLSRDIRVHSLLEVKGLNSKNTNSHLNKREEKKRNGVVLLGRSCSSTGLHKQIKTV